MKKLLIYMPLLFLAACVSPAVKLVEAEWTSMTHTEVPLLKDVSEAGTVKGDFCFSSFGKGNVGLMDEAILAAQTKYTVDYIRNPVFMMNTKDACVSVEGQGYRMKKT
ncbi:MAG: hypothetical protein ACAH59_11740, partial [Pseudobdellovibrionaceae bacterium]